MEQTKCEYCDDAEATINLSDISCYLDNIHADCEKVCRDCANEIIGEKMSEMESTMQDLLDFQSETFGEPNWTVRIVADVTNTQPQQ